MTSKLQMYLTSHVCFGIYTKDILSKRNDICLGLAIHCGITFNSKRLNLKVHQQGTASKNYDMSMQ